MRKHSVHHGTIVLARTYAAPVARVFAALSDPGERMRVYGASGLSGITFARPDLQAGRDTYHFGNGETLSFRAEATYQEIVPDSRIVCTDVVYEGDVRLAIGTTTFEVLPVASGTQLKITAQMAWLDGADTIEGADARYATLLENIERHLGVERIPARRR